MYTSTLRLRSGQIVRYKGEAKVVCRRVTPIMSRVSVRSALPLELGVFFAAEEDKEGDDGQAQEDADDGASDDASATAVAVAPAVCC